jgi:hypothetical protein
MSENMLPKDDGTVGSKKATIYYWVMPVLAIIVSL